MSYNREAHADFITARSDYLRRNGWKPEPALPGAPVWGQDSTGPDLAGQLAHREDNASRIQETRDTDSERELADARA